MADARPVIYIVDASVAVTGAFVAARNLAKCLREDVQVVLVLPCESQIAASQLTDFARVMYLPLARPSRRLSALLMYLPSLVYGSVRLRLAMRGYGATCLILNDFYLLHGAVLRLLAFRGVILSYLRGDPARFAGALAKPILQLVAMTSNHILAVSRYVQGLAGTQTELVYDYTTQRPRAPKHFAASDFKPLLYIGNYILGKGQDVALAAFARAARHDATLQLVFCGGDMGLPRNQAFRGALEAQARALGLADRITFHGAREDVSALLEDAFAAVNFSDSESFSMTVLEASAAGVPVIATRSGGPAEIILDGQTGILIPLRDVAAAEAAMLQLAADPTRAAAMGEAGAAHVAATFSPDTLRNAMRNYLRL